MSRTIAAPSSLETSLYRKIGWRLLPFILLCYLICYLDRVNMSFGKLQFVKDLNLTDAQYGLAAALFYVTYTLFDIPSNLVLARIGVRKTLARIMILWGTFGALQMFIQSAPQLYVLRLLFGAAEAGFIPGIMLYLTYWFPNALRGRVTSIFLLGLPISGMIGAPISGAIMQNMHDVLGFRGWQWLFLLEALPAIVVGAIAFFYLEDSPAHAKWLSSEEKARLTGALADDHARSASTSSQSLRGILRDPRLYLLALVNFAANCVINAVNFWTPSILKSVGVSNVSHIGWLTSGMSTAAAIGMVLFCYSSDRAMERRLHYTVAALLVAGGLFFLPMAQHSIAGTVALMMFATIGSFSLLALYWTIPTSYFRGKGAAGGIAFVSMAGAAGGFVSPLVIGWLKVQTGTLYNGMLVMSAIALTGIVLVWACLPREKVAQR
ncbi:Putative tartrate transporter [Paraburkholderia domus]|uniref:MFS transporter n=1 Tax=Paraburkholderia domus TaxID=2793075 RepID=UPI0019148F8B|nr:MFS transporter [Paraburkholderia domus]MBK5050451.1 MFS transporter [Burkholderia sp. R-70006]CAE6754780.1 Putative tartrate transporter [Paraburkholderia domus]